MKVNIYNLYEVKLNKNNRTHFYVGTHSDVGLPWRPVNKTEAERDRIVNQYKAWLDHKLESKDQKVCRYMNMMFKALQKYGEINLFCYCNPKGSHAEYIKEKLLSACAPLKPEPAQSKDSKIRKARFKVLKKVGYSGTETPLQVVELQHQFKTDWISEKGEVLKLKSTCIKNHYLVVKNQTEYYFVKEA